MIDDAGNAISFMMEWKSNFKIPKVINSASECPDTQYVLDEK